MNSAYGPWKTAAWFGLMVDQAEELAAMLGPNDPLVMKLWSQILVDKGPDLCMDDTIIGHPARKAFIASLQATKSVSVEGPKASTQRWWSWSRSFSEWDPEHHSR